MLRNAVWPPNLVGRTLDQSVTHCWVRGHAGVSQGQPEVKFFRNALWPPNLAERTPDQSVMHRWVKDHAGVSWGQPEDNCLEMHKAIKGSQCYKALCSCRYSSNYKIVDIQSKTPQKRKKIIIPPLLFKIRKIPKNKKHSFIYKL